MPFGTLSGSFDRMRTRCVCHLGAQTSHMERLNEVLSEERLRALMRGLARGGAASGGAPVGSYRYLEPTGGSERVARTHFDRHRRIRSTFAGGSSTAKHGRADDARAPRGRRGELECSFSA